MLFLNVGHQYVHTDYENRYWVDKDAETGVFMEVFVPMTDVAIEAVGHQQ